MVKRILDVAGSIMLLLVLLPVFVLIALVIYFTDGRPVIYKQVRVGRNNKAFSMFKFRTMRVGTPEVAKESLKASQDKYLTRNGKFLRRTSLDELPQLVNILAGDMSFVGPRPALHNQEDLTKKRNDFGVQVVRPGVTGLAQVSGREDLSMDAKVQLDALYVREMGILLDLRILLSTITALVSGRGAY